MPYRRTVPTEQAVLEQFEKDLFDKLNSIANLYQVDALVGIPFHDEEDTIPGVVRTARRGLAQMGLSGRSLILCVGPDGGRSTLEAALRTGRTDDNIPVHGFCLRPGVTGRAWTVCAIMKAASRLTTPLLLLQPDLIPQSAQSESAGEGFSLHWIAPMLEAVKDHNQDLALAQFSHHPLAHPVESLLTFPFLAGVFGVRLRQATPGVVALSTNLTQMCLAGADFHSRETGIYGIDPWLVIRAIVHGRSICRVPLGAPSRQHRSGSLEAVFRQVTHALLHQAVLHARTWLEAPETITSPAQYGSLREVPSPPYQLDTQELFRLFQKEFNRLNDSLYQEVLPQQFRDTLRRLAAGSAGDVTFSAQEWIEVLRGFTLMYGFESRYHPSDIVDGLFPLFLARLVGFANETSALERAVASRSAAAIDSARLLLDREAEHAFSLQCELFIEARPSFKQEWYRRESETTSYLPRLGSWEFVPNVGVIVPQVIEAADGTQVWANQVYQELIDRYRSEFMDFLATHLGITEITDSRRIVRQLELFMRELDRTLREDLYPCQLTSLAGAQEMSHRIFQSFTSSAAGTTGDDRPLSWQLTADAAETILKKLPPGNLILQLGYRDVTGLLGEVDPRDALGMSAWTDYRQYLDQVLDFIEKSGSPDWFHRAPLRPFVADLQTVSVETEWGGTELLSYLAGRVVSSKLQKSFSGEYPHLWFFLNVIQNSIGAEMFSTIVDECMARSRSCVADTTRFVREYGGRDPLSAYSGFENMQQRELVTRLTAFAQLLDRDGRPGGRQLRAAADVYHLSITLPDATFIPFSAWTWASYSYRGGISAPTPLSSVVERDWASIDFLTRYLERADRGNALTVEQTIIELVRDGRSPDNLRLSLLGVAVDPDHLVISQTPRLSTKPAGILMRLSEAPILEPIAGHAWESRYVLNAAALRLDGTIYILYRAFGDDEISRIGLAWTRDGVTIEGRLGTPIFDIDSPEESAGCEDPRVTLIGDTIYMLYTAWDKTLPQIAMASIPAGAFLEQRFDQWRRDGLGFPGLENKDAVLYPETFDGRYVLYHRIDPNLWISYLEHLRCPWPRTGQKIITGPRPGMMWDGVKIGAGAPPIKTTHGWLNIYHGVDYERSYRLGVLFMALDDPSEIIYQSPNPILEPALPFEIGDPGGSDYWVPHVVFTCGAVPAVDKEILGLDDEILVYYGCADTVIGVAAGKIGSLVPVLDPQP